MTTNNASELDRQLDAQLTTRTSAGPKVENSNGRQFGRVSDLLIDERERTVRLLLVEHGGSTVSAGRRPSFPLTSPGSTTTRPTSLIRRTASPTAHATTPS
jgi:hypothetical protein